MDINAFTSEKPPQNITSTHLSKVFQWFHSRTCTPATAHVVGCIHVIIVMSIDTRIRTLLMATPPPIKHFQIFKRIIMNETKYIPCGQQDSDKQIKNQNYECNEV
eukprot:660467_1